MATKPRRRRVRHESYSGDRLFTFPLVPWPAIPTPRQFPRVFFYYTPFSSVARGVPYLLHIERICLPSTQLTIIKSLVGDTQWEKEKGNNRMGRVGKRVTTYGGWGMADATGLRK